MAVVVNAENPTLLDWKAALDPNGNIGALIEMLRETNEIIPDMTFIEGNEATSHVMNVQTGLPPTVWRRLYEGISPGKGRREQVREAVGWMEAYNQIDAQLVALNGNGNAFRLQEARMQVESMSQELAEKWFYGNPDGDPRNILGLANRYTRTSTANAENARNVINGGSTSGGNRSIWLVSWSPMACFAFTPKGMPAGLQMEDKGRVTAENFGGTGKLLEVYRMHFKWDVGIGLADWRYVARICNIQLSALTDDASGGANLPVLMAKAMRKVPRFSAMRKAFYMSSELIGYLESQLSSAVRESTLTIEQVGGVEVQKFRGVPIRQVDQLEFAETQVPA